MTINVLLADDETIFRETFSQVLEAEQMEVTCCADGTEALAALHEKRHDIAILDIQMPGLNGIDVLTEIKKTHPQTPVIMITAYGKVEMAVEAIKLGAADYIMKPVIFDDIIAKIKQITQYKALERENESLKQQLQQRHGMENIISQSPLMQPVFDTIRKVARTRTSVLITGESGTGKELAARAIHVSGSTRNKPFVAVNCSAIPETLIESELFGHKKGSFTGAIDDKKGLFEEADGGTLFLDEIGYMPPNCQVKLLRALEDRKITPVGGVKPVEIDLRVVAATNKDLQEEIKIGQFREDLFYRINVVGIHLPPLRQRKEDIPLLIDHFLKKYSTEMGKAPKQVPDDVLAAMMNLDWKGNIRELQNVVERSVIFAEEDMITMSDLGLTQQDTAVGGDEKLSAAMKTYERAYVQRMLSKYNYDKPQVAKALGVGLSSLYRKIDELGIPLENHTKAPAQKAAQ